MPDVCPECGHRVETPRPFECPECEGFFAELAFRGDTE